MYCMLLFLLFPALVYEITTVVPFGNALFIVMPPGYLITKPVTPESAIDVCAAVAERQVYIG